MIQAALIVQSVLVEAGTSAGAKAGWASRGGGGGSHNDAVKQGGFSRDETFSSKDEDVFNKGQYSVNVNKKDGSWTLSHNKTGDVLGSGSDSKSLGKEMSKWSKRGGKSGGELHGRGYKSSESWIDQGKQQPAGSKSVDLYTAQATIMHSPLLRKGVKIVPKVDKQVPVAAFVDDVRRKLKLRKAMQSSEAEFTQAMPGRLETKEDVNYRYAENPARSCGKCTHFLFPGACDIVAGLIRPVDTCNEFEAKDDPTRRQASPVVQATFVDSAKKESAVPGTDEHAALLSDQGWQFHANDHDTIVYTNPGTDEEIRVWDSGNWIRYTANQQVVSQGQGVESLRQDLSAHETEGGPGSGRKGHRTERPYAEKPGAGLDSFTGKPVEGPLDFSGKPFKGPLQGPGKGEPVNPKISPEMRAKLRRRFGASEGGPGSGRRPGGKTIYAKPEPEGDDERQISTFTRREKPGDRAERIKGKKVDPAQAKAIQRAFLVVRASLVDEGGPGSGRRKGFRRDSAAGPGPMRPAPAGWRPPISLGSRPHGGVRKIMMPGGKTRIVRADRRATLSDEAMSTMGAHVAISDMPGSDSQQYTAPGLRHGRRGAV